MVTIKRKILRFGGYSFLFTLPKDWVRKNDIDVGDYLNIEMENDFLVIRKCQD